MQTQNLLDEQIVEIAKKGGVIGVCFCPEFLTDSFDASIDDIIRHIEYICGLVGCEHIGFGSDFDGIETFPRGIDNLSKIYDILNELLKRNYTNEQVENIAGINFMRVIKELL